MGPFEILLVGVIHFVVVGLDVIAFFVSVRILHLWHPCAPLRALNDVGAPIVNPLSGRVRRLLPAISRQGGVRSDVAAAGVVIAIILVCRLALVLALRG